MARPEALPNFTSPPLNEVLVGVQFEPPVGYHQIRAGEVWSLFKERYPIVQDLPPLQPVFETFGLQHRQSSEPQISIASGAMHDRFWFVRKDQAELIQFQQDRLLHNWRKVGDGSNPYPRFEAMISEFRKELSALQSYVGSLAPQELRINQCEVNYINHIDFNRSAGERFSDWLRITSFDGGDPDDFVCNFREIIRDKESKPIGRLYVESALGYTPDGQEKIKISLVVRGAPEKANVESALEFINAARETIVNKFADITTDVAHKKWGRTK